MPKAARLGDRISHTNAYAGLILGALAGAAIAALLVTTGGLAAVAIAAAGGAGLGGALGEFALGFSTYDAGAIVGASEDVFTNQSGAACATDPVTCSDHGAQQIAEGSAVVGINGLPAARLGDRTTCGAEISSASGDVDIGGPTQQVLQVNPEVPLVAELIVGALGLIGGVGAVAMAAKGLKLLMAARLLTGLAGGVGLGAAGSRIGGAQWGEGSRGQRQLALGSGLVGGALASGALGGRLDPFNYRVTVDPNTLGANGGNIRVRYAGSPPGSAPRGPAGQTLRNGNLAGGVHPKTGIPFDAQGYPDFSGVTTKTVTIDQTGTRGGDFAAANKAAGYDSTPEGMTWHHHQDGTTMQLVPRDIHAQTGHTGGFRPGK